MLLLLLLVLLLLLLLALLHTRTHGAWGNGQGHSGCSMRGHPTCPVHEQNNPVQGIRGQRQSLPPCCPGFRRW